MKFTDLFDMKALRKSIGGKIEIYLDSLVQDSVIAKSKASIKAAGHAAVESLVDKHYEDLIKGVHGKVKYWIGKIDGEEGIAIAAAPAPVEVMSTDMKA